MKELGSKIWEALLSALPITLIVYLMALLLSVVREDMVDAVMKCLEGKFHTIRDNVLSALY